MRAIESESEIESEIEIEIESDREAEAGESDGRGPHVKGHGASTRRDRPPDLYHRDTLS